MRISFAAELLAIRKWTLIGLLALLCLVIFDSPAYVPSAAFGTVIRRLPPKITGAARILWGSKRWHRASHHRRRHEGRYRQNHKYAPHAKRYLLLSWW